MSKSMIFILSAVSLFGLTGCYDSQEVSWQKSWNEDIRRALTVEYKFRDYGSNLLLTEQLIALVSEPDYKMFPTEFEKMIPKEPLAEGLTYREWNMMRLWGSYQQDKRQEQIYSDINSAGKWREALDFNKCMLWVYDESQHFSEPLHSKDWVYCLFCAKPRLRAYIFFVEERQVVGNHTMGIYTPFLFNVNK